MGALGYIPHIFLVQTANHHLFFTKKFRERILDRARMVLLCQMHVDHRSLEFAMSELLCDCDDRDAQPCMQGPAVMPQGVRVNPWHSDFSENLVQFLPEERFRDLSVRRRSYLQRSLKRWKLISSEGMTFSPRCEEKVSEYYN